MNKYESMYIVSTKLDDEAIAGKVSKFSGIITENGGTIIEVNEWGKRKLAYSINYETEGYYVLVTFEGNSEMPKELERNLKNDESILRFVVIRPEN